MANPGGEKLVREASWVHAGKFASRLNWRFRIMSIGSGTEK